MEYIGVSALRAGHHNQRIRVRASRVWHYRGGLETGKVKDIRMVLIDSQGDSIYAVMPTDLIDTYINNLHESAGYELSMFRISASPPIMNPVQNPLFITFTRLTNIRPVPLTGEAFPKLTYNLSPLTELPTPNDTPGQLTDGYSGHLIDVVGVIRGITYISTHGMDGRNVTTSRRCIVIADNSGNEIKVNLWNGAAFRFAGENIYNFGQEESAVVLFVGMTVHSREGHSELAGGVASRWYINVDIPEINILRAGLISLFRPIERLPAPCQIILRPQVNGHYPTRPLCTLLNHDFFQNEDGMFRSVIRTWSLTHAQWWAASCKECRQMSIPVASSYEHSNGYTCSNVSCACTDADLQYHLRLLGSDNTGQAEFVLTGRVAERFIGISPRQVILNNYGGDIEATNLAVIASQLPQIPPELAAVVNGRYKFFLYVENKSFQGNYASFDVLAVETHYAPE